MTIRRHRRRFWRVEEEDGTLVCVTVYKKGAREVARRLTARRGTETTDTTIRTEETTGNTNTAEKKGGR